MITASSTTLDNTSSPYLLDGSAAPLAYENAQKNVLAIQVYVEREYIWGPGDKGVDELLVQFDHTADRKPWWVIQDGGGDGGDVVAVCDTIATGSNAGKRMCTTLRRGQLGIEPPRRVD